MEKIIVDRKHLVGDPNARVSLWNTVEERSIVGATAPKRKNLISFLRTNPVYVVYEGQKKKNAPMRVFTRRMTEQQVLADLKEGDRVTLFNKVTKQKISGRNSPLKKNVHKYLKGHRHLSVYVGQGLDKYPEDEYDGTIEDGGHQKVDIWNPKTKTRVNGNARPSQKYLKAYFERHPDHEIYNGQDKELIVHSNKMLKRKSALSCYEQSRIGKRARIRADKPSDNLLPAKPEHSSPKISDIHYDFHRERVSEVHGNGVAHAIELSNARLSLLPSVSPADSMNGFPQQPALHALGERNQIASLSQEQNRNRKCSSDHLDDTAVGNKNNAVPAIDRDSTETTGTCNTGVDAFSCSVSKRCKPTGRPVLSGSSYNGEDGRVLFPNNDVNSMHTGTHLKLSCANCNKRSNGLPSQGQCGLSVPEHGLHSESCQCLPQARNGATENGNCQTHEPRKQPLAEMSVPECPLDIYLEEFFPAVGQKRHQGENGNYEPEFPSCGWEEAAKEQIERVGDLGVGELHQSLNLINDAVQMGANHDDFFKIFDDEVECRLAESYLTQGTGDNEHLVELPPFDLD